MKKKKVVIESNNKDVLEVKPTGSDQITYSHLGTSLDDKVVSAMVSPLMMKAYEKVEGCENAITLYSPYNSYCFLSKLNNLDVNLIKGKIGPESVRYVAERAATIDSTIRQILIEGLSDAFSWFLCIVKYEFRAIAKQYLYFNCYEDISNYLESLLLGYNNGECYVIDKDFNKNNIPLVKELADCMLYSFSIASFDDEYSLYFTNVDLPKYMNQILNVFNIALAKNTIRTSYTMSQKSYYDEDEDRMIKKEPKFEHEKLNDYKLKMLETMDKYLYSLHNSILSLYATTLEAVKNEEFRNVLCPPEYRGEDFTQEELNSSRLLFGIKAENDLQNIINENN